MFQSVDSVSKLSALTIIRSAETKTLITPQRKACSEVAWAFMQWITYVRHCSFETSLAATRTPETNWLIPHSVWVSSGLAWSLWSGL